jgi:hypothetical protein
LAPKETACGEDISVLPSDSQSSHLVGIMALPFLSLDFLHRIYLDVPIINAMLARILAEEHHADDLLERLIRRILV